MRNGRPRSGAEGGGEAACLSTEAARVVSHWGFPCSVYLL